MSRCDLRGVRAVKVPEAEEAQWWLASLPMLVLCLQNDAQNRSPLFQARHVLNQDHFREPRRPDTWMRHGRLCLISRPNIRLRQGLVHQDGY